MFARKVAVRLKPNSLPQFTNLVDGQILPWLRKQEGFLDLITLAVPDGSEVATISFWDHEGNAQAFNSNGYPEALKLLEKLLDGIPYVKAFTVVSSTLHKVAPAQATAARNRVEGSTADETGPLLAYRAHETSA
jgi:heme-degrading monooxygenase HmoA